MLLALIILKCIVESVHTSTDNIIVKGYKIIILIWMMFGHGQVAVTVTHTVQFNLCQQKINIYPGQGRWRKKMPPVLVPKCMFCYQQEGHTVVH